VSEQKNKITGRITFFVLHLNMHQFLSIFGRIDQPLMLGVVIQIQVELQINLYSATKNKKKNNMTQRLFLPSTI